MSDIEKHGKPIGEESSSVSIGDTSNKTNTELLDDRSSWQRFKDSWKPAEDPEFDTTGMTEEQIFEKRLAVAPLARSLSNRHIQMIAIGGCIGSGLFISSGNSLAQGGPAGVIIGFAIVGVMLFCMMHSLGEVAVRYPVQGSFTMHASRFIDDSWGFAMSWNYVLLWIVTFPLELIGAAVVLGYWDTDNNDATRVNKVAWVALFFVVCSLIGLFGARAFGEVEALLSMIKVVTVIGFCIFGIVITCGGGPPHHYFGAHYWYDPGPFANGFKGVINVFVNSAFAFSGTELSALASAETKNPAKVLPRAVKQVFWRILLFYLVSLTIVFCLVPYTDPHLGTTQDGNASPFVLAAVKARVHAIPSIINAVILLAALSVANSSLYGCSRTLAAIANAGQAPKIFGYIDRDGRPLVALITTIIFGLIGFCAASDQYGEVFNWLIALSGQASLYTWGSICLVHLRFRRAMTVQGRSLDELPFKSAVGVPGAWIGLGLNLAIIGLQFWVALFPIGVKTPNASDFFQVMLSFPIVIFFFLAHKLWTRHWPHRAKDIDLDTGAVVKNPDIVDESAEKVKRLRQPIKFIVMLYRFWC